VCGIKPFYVPRSNPDGYSVNVNCLDPSGIEKIDITDFEGRNREENGEGLAERSRQDSYALERAGFAAPAPGAKA
jgi:hypothetical protein